MQKHTLVATADAAAVRMSVIGMPSIIFKRLNIIQSKFEANLQ